jgi:hypothetical protein
VIPIESPLYRLRPEPTCADGAVPVDSHDNLGNRIAPVLPERLRATHGHHVSFEPLKDERSARQAAVRRLREAWRDGKQVWECKALA